MMAEIDGLPWQWPWPRNWLQLGTNLNPVTLPLHCPQEIMSTRLLCGGGFQHLVSHAQVVIFLYRMNWYVAKTVFALNQFYSHFLTSILIYNVPTFRQWGGESEGSFTLFSQDTWDPRAFLRPITMSNLNPKKREREILAWQHRKRHQGEREKFHVLILYCPQ